MNRSEWIQDFAFRITLMANGIKTPDMHGNTMRALKFGPTYKEGKDWRATCMRCCGTGYVEGEWAREDIKGRGKICFGCMDKTGHTQKAFRLPTPSIYKQFIAVWACTKGTDEIRRVALSELQYVTEMEGEDETREWELEILQMWEWLLRKLNSMNAEGNVMDLMPTKVKEALARVEESRTRARGDEEGEEECESKLESAPSADDANGPADDANGSAGDTNAPATCKDDMIKRFLDLVVSYYVTKGK